MLSPWKKLLGWPHSVEIITLWYGWYQKSYLVDTCNIEKDLCGHSAFLLHIVDGLTCLASPKFTLILLIFHPEALRLESLSVEKDEVALPVLLGPIAQRRDHHVAVRQAVGGVRGAHAQGVHLPRLDDLRIKRGLKKQKKKHLPWLADLRGKRVKAEVEFKSSHLVQLWVERVRFDVDHIDPVRTKGRNDQPKINLAPTEFETWLFVFSGCWLWSPKRITCSWIWRGRRSSCYRRSI